MSRHTLALATVFVGISTAAWPMTRACPASYGHRKLTSVSVYDGPPSEVASLMPDDRGVWKLGYKPASNEGRFYLGCTYGKNGTTLPIELPTNVTTCRIGDYPQVACR